MTQKERTELLYRSIGEKILVLDGAYGVQLQSKKLTEQDYQGEIFKGHSHPLKNNVDVLNITQPKIVAELHSEYLNAGADIITTNTFSSTSVSQADFNLEKESYALNVAGAQIAREEADRWTQKNPSKPRWVAGSLGPTNKTTSVAIDLNDPSMRSIEFDVLKDSYSNAIQGLYDGGIDILLVETIFDTLNAKAAVLAADEFCKKNQVTLPLILSWTATDLSGRNLSGQTIEAFWISIKHANPFAIGLNCSFGARELRESVNNLAKIADVPVIAYPNAGLPNALGEFDETPKVTSDYLHEWTRNGLVNIVGGCCGTTPDHIQQICKRIESELPRQIPTNNRNLQLAGIDKFEIIN
jgi:5-methyltetrahydrofolate--homocysteine methyltransferase|tara:strand:- start:2771 stop:3835 length:1065 start_codon:yes stop_codon:yes gene_type:complete